MSPPAGTASAVPSSTMNTYLRHSVGHVVALEIVLTCFRNGFTGALARLRFAPRLANHIVLRVRGSFEQAEQAGAFERMQPRRETHRDIALLDPHERARADVRAFGEVLPRHIARNARSGHRAPQSSRATHHFSGRKVLVVALHF